MGAVVASFISRTLFSLRLTTKRVFVVACVGDLVGKLPRTLALTLIGLSSP